MPVDLPFHLAGFYRLMIALFLIAIVSAEVDWASLRADIVSDVLQGGPEPFKHNGPFLVRLAWHCAGTYRAVDGRGGCDGGRITQMPEYSWRDNAGLPGAQTLLLPLKNKYDGLSWGDLIVFAGNVAIEEMGGPKLQFCGGRVDSTPEEAKAESEIFNVRRPGKHHDLIYVDPGQDGAPEIRETFGDMGFNDQETVAIVGGGHAFGGCHASRSGFNGYWTKTPAMWTNDYYNQLLEVEYEPYTVPSTGNPQYMDKATGTLMMLKTDIALATDPDYREWVEIYAGDYDRATRDFAIAWEKLMNRDMGERPCVGPDHSQPEAAPSMDVTAVKEAIRAMGQDEAFATLAWNCARTFRGTDHRGGCNGARLRFEPEKSWASNQNAADALALLEPLQASSGLSMSDLIVLAGTTAAESMVGVELSFCPGRTDDADGAKSELLVDGPLKQTLKRSRDYFNVMGLNPRESVALTKVLDSSMLQSIVGEGRSDFSQALGTFIGDEFAQLSLKDVFSRGWTKLMNADRFGACDNLSNPIPSFQGHLKTEL